MNRPGWRSRAGTVTAGMVTAELAVAIPAVILILSVCLAGLMAAVAQVRCVDAARLASRAAARGDDLPSVRGQALGAAPPGARVVVTRDGTDVVVTVVARTGGWGGVLPSWDVTATGRTPVEQPAPAARAVR